MRHFVDVMLPIPLAKNFTYKISEEQALVLEQGMRVSVPFGKRKIYTAIVMALHQKEPKVYEAKEIDQILDDAPLINATQLNHWQWLASYYMCTLGEVIRAGLPKAFLLESETVVSLSTDEIPEESTLTDEEFLIFEALQHQNNLSIDDIIQITERKNVLPLLKNLIDKKVVVTNERLYEEYKPKIVRHVQLTAAYKNEDGLEALINELNRAPVQRELVLSLFQLQAGMEKPIKVSDLTKRNKSFAAAIKALVDKGVLNELHIRQDRIAYAFDDSLGEGFNLSPQQEKAFENIKSSFSKDKPVLLYGVTASGKTEVYLKLIEAEVKKGKQVLYLLPEIALTSQLITRLQRFFGNKVAVFHSKYSVNERVEVWNNVSATKPKAQITIGARSALFLPFSDLGLVIIDEEHEGSFKQFDPAPRYHARDAALVLAKMHGANCLLGSATPSLESYKNAQDGKYGLATLTERYGNILMPEIQLVDIKEATRKKRMKGHFSERLFLKIEEALLNREQVILFQNRRGFAPIVECTTCGFSERCPNCDVSLTYHQVKNQLRCHYCGYHELLPTSCKACGNSTLDKLGFGTEQIQEELEQLFPEANIARMDLDTTRGKYAYQKIIAAFENHDIDILVGTQMVTKGLDFRNVGLVGIMNADTLLNFPDYRAHERSFQLLTQVAGRAGRTAKRGEVLIQSYNPYHRILQQVTTNSFEEMYAEQLYERERFNYPPSVRMVKLTLKSKDFNRLNEASVWFAKALRSLFEDQVLGPEAPVVSRIKREYLKNIVVKIPKIQSLSSTKKSIKRIEQSFDAIGIYKSVKLVYNVDHI